MSAATNLALVRRYYAECANDPDPAKRQALAVAEHILRTDFAMYYNNDTDAEATRGRDKHQDFLVDHAQAFPGERWTVEGSIADEVTVACRWRVQATHADTGNPMDLRGADFFTVAQGQLAALRRFLDFRTLMDQMQPMSASPKATA